MADEGKTNQKTVGTTAQDLDDSRELVQSIVTVFADEDNTGTLYVGYESTDLDTTGIPLTAGREKTFFVNDVAKLKIVADAAGQGYSYDAQ